jgi:hypothetical protein
MFIEQGAMQLNHIKHICMIFKYIHLMYGPSTKKPTNITISYVL